MISRTNKDTSLLNLKLGELSVSSPLYACLSTGSTPSFLQTAQNAREQPFMTTKALRRRRYLNSKVFKCCLLMIHNWFFV